MDLENRIESSKNLGLTGLASDLDFRNQAVFITGAASGIGEATATMIHQFGGHIIALDIQDDKLAELSDKFGAERISTIPFDLSETNPNAYKKLAEQIISASPSGHVDAFIMSAGVVQLTKGLGLRGNPAWEFQKLNQINAMSNADIFRELADHLSNDARIVMVSSPIVSRQDFKTPGYAMSKGLMEDVTKQMMGDLVIDKPDVRVTGFVAPPVQNFLRTDLKPDEPMHAHPHGEDVAELPARLASRSVLKDHHGQAIIMGYSSLREHGKTPDGHDFDYMPRGERGGFLYNIRTREIATGGGDLGEFIAPWDTVTSRQLQGLGDTPKMDETIALQDVYKPPAHIAKLRSSKTELGNIGDTENATFITKDVSTSETPMFNPFDECYYFVDIEYGDVHQYNPQTGVDKKWHLDKGMVGGLVINEDGTLIVNAEEGLFAFNPKKNALAKIADIEGDPNGPHKMRPNDMNIFPLADGSSRIAVGLIPVDRTKVGAEEKPSTVYVINPEDMSLKAIWDNHVTSNALCGYSENGQNIVFYAETDKNHSPRMWRANYNGETDALENETLFLTKANDDFLGGRPDGAHIIEVDGRKLVAVANLDTHRVVGYDVESGQAVMSVDAPVTDDEQLTLTHAVFGKDAAGDNICLINSSKRTDAQGNMKLGVAVIVPIKAEFDVVSHQSVAAGYPSFTELTSGKKIEKIRAVAVSGHEKNIDYFSALGIF